MPVSLLRVTMPSLSRAQMNGLLVQQRDRILRLGETLIIRMFALPTVSLPSCVNIVKQPSLCFQMMVDCHYFACSPKCAGVKSQALKKSC